MKNLFFLLLGLVSNLLIAETPIATINRSVDEIIKIVADNSGDAAKTIRHEKIFTAVKKVFNFEEMSKRSLGANWKDTTPEQQKEFVSVFSDLLAKTYIDRVEQAKPGMIAVLSERVENDKALVKTTVTMDGQVFPLDYKLIQGPQGWTVYDVVIENIGLVSNYRNEFSAIIRKEKFEGLIKQLKAKVAAQAAAAKA